MLGTRHLGAGNELLDAREEASGCLGQVTWVPRYLDALLTCLLHMISSPLVYDLRELSLLPILNWFEVGLALGLDKDGLDIIQENHRDDVVRQRTMFDMWLHHGEVTGEVLLKALVDTYNIEAALKLYDIKSN